MAEKTTSQKATPNPKPDPKKTEPPTTQQEQPATTPEKPVTPKPETPKPESPTPEPVTLESLAKLVAEHTEQILELQQTLARKRKAVPNGKVQIKDTKTGKVYPSKNGTYKALLASGELKDLIAQGVFGDDPEHNTFGWYALEKAFPNRFEVVQAEKASTNGQS